MNDESNLSPRTKQILTAVAFVGSSAAIGFVGAIAVGIVYKTAMVSLANLGHLLETKGKVWESSKFRDLRELP